MNVNDAQINLREHHRIETQRSRSGLSFGTREECRELFIEAFKAADATVTSYQHLPEYDKVIDWMTDTQAKGLFLTGSCGRGKSVILTGVLPTIFYMKQNRILRPINAVELQTKAKSILGKWAAAIDEVGIESIISDYGAKSEGFNLVMNDAENRLALVFATTNLNAKDILDRYGDRTLDRIQRLCRIVKFEGPSLRK